MQCRVARVSEIEYKHSQSRDYAHAALNGTALPAKVPQSQITSLNPPRILRVANHGIRMSNPIAYSPRAAALAFDPPLSERLLRRMIRQNIFKVVKIGRRTYLLRSEIEDALRELGSNKS